MNLVTLLIAALFIVLGVVIRSGKGSWLIAGYNTMTKDEKEKYDEKALCKFISNLLFACALIRIIEARAQYLNHIPLVITGFILIALLAIGAAVYANTGNRFKI